MNSEHYLAKIERNTNVLDKAPEGIREECAKNIVWARELSVRLDNFDYDVRNKAIKSIHDVLDADYKRMGFELSNEEATITEEPKKRHM